VVQVRRPPELGVSAFPRFKSAVDQGVGLQVARLVTQWCAVEASEAERANGRPQHARTIDVQADDLEYRGEARESQASIARVEIKAVQAALKAAGGRKVGGWLRRSSVTGRERGRRRCQQRPLRPLVGVEPRDREAGSLGTALQPRRRAAADKQFRQLVDEVAGVTEQPRWHVHCRGIVDVFFPRSSSPKASAEAEKICATCPVRGPCGEAGRFEPDGVWAGRRRYPANTPRGRLQRKAS
jgi:hypothetical protein